MEAIGAAFHNSDLLFFSDASAKDVSRANQVIARAQDKGIGITYALTGSCSPVDPAYVRTAEETGGQVLRLRSSEIERLFGLIQPQLEGDLALIDQRRGELGAGGSARVPVPVDSSMEGLVVSVSVDGKGDVRLIRPSGEPVAAGDTDTTVADLTSGEIINIDGPETGEWQIEIEGSGSFSATAKGNSPIELSRFDFVSPNRDIHGGFFPIPGQPVVGEPGLGEAVLHGPFSSARFELVNRAGEPIKSPSLERNFPDANPDHFLGRFDLPAVPFRISVSGKDENGRSYRRQYPVVYRAQTVAVAAADARLVNVAPGKEATVAFEVTNRGEPGSFRNRASDALGFVASVEPSTMTLDSGETGEVAVALDVPVDAAGGDSSRITLTATRSDDESVFNSAEIVASVTDNRPPDCSGAKGVQVGFWPPNHKLVAVDIPAITEVVDPDGDEIGYSVLGITQDEPVSGPGSGSTAPDGRGVGGPVAEIRAERSGTGNGRVYSVTFQATDGRGGSCEGEVEVSVPHDQGSRAVDDGQAYDSTNG